MILLSLLASVYSSTLSWTSGQAGSLRICTPLTPYALRYFAFDILDLYLYFLDVLLGLISECLVTLGMFCSLLSGGWKLSSYLSMRSGCGRVHGACLPSMGQNTLAFLFHDCFCLGTPCSHRLPRSFFHIMWLLGCILCGYPHCETCVFACLLCRLLVNVPFCCCKRLIRWRICLLFPLIPTLSWALFSLILPRDPNDEGRPRKHLLPARRRRLSHSFLLYSTAVCMNIGFRPSSICRIWLLLVMLDVCMSNKNFLRIDFLVLPNFWWNRWVKCLSKTVLRRWGVIANFASPLLLFLRVFVLPEGSLITTV
jgi:hypothetical protein